MVLFSSGIMFCSLNFFFLACSLSGYLLPWVLKVRVRNGELLGERDTVSRENELWKLTRGVVSCMDI